jgi:hypothetical protein
MKRFIKFKLFLIFCAVALALSGISQTTNNMNSQFKTPEEAANKGKADLLEVLKSGRDLNLGVSAEELANAIAGKAIAKKQLNFEKLLNLENTKSLREVEGESLNTVVPMMLSGKVATIIEVRQTKEGWVVAGLGDMSLSRDLSTVLKVSGNEELIIYEVPNLQSTIYTAAKDDEEMYFTTITGNESLRAQVSRAQLFPVLQAAAKDFEAEWGERVKKERLVK